MIPIIYDTDKNSEKDSIQGLFQYQRVRRMLGALQ